MLKLAALPIGLLVLGMSRADLTGTVTTSSGKPARFAVVFLEGSGLVVKPAPNVSIEQRGKQFIPHVLAVPIGTTVDFPNRDTVFHNVFAEFEAKKFDLGMYPRGSSRHQKFGRPGLVSLFCSVHSQMSAYIFVVDTPLYAVADVQGRFSIKCPAGDYRLKVWHESGEILRETVQLAPSSQRALRTSKL